MSTVAGRNRRPPNRLFTLAIASVASAAAAIFTSKVWNGGVIGTAAVTPVVVALTEDALRRVAGRLAPRRGPSADEPEDAAPAEPRPRARRFSGFSILGALAVGIAAFAIAALALTIPEAVAGRSVTGDNDTTTFFGTNDNKPWGDGRNRNQCFDSLDALKGCISDLLERE